MKSQEIKQILHRVDEFNLLQIDDTIANLVESQKIYRVDDASERQERIIEFLRDGLLVSLDRDEYVLDGWGKV
jgi:hypothetical protein